MKKSFLLGFLGLAATTLSTFGQGTIILDNYLTSGPKVTYGNNGVPVNGVLGDLPYGVVGAPVASGPWTIGFYYAVGNVTNSVASDPTYMADPSTLGPLILATGAGSTASLAGPTVGGSPGFFFGNTFAVPGTSVAGGQTITLELSVYNGPSYDTSTIRSHDEAFTMITTANSDPAPAQVGKFMTPLAIYAMPEPSLFALSGIAATLMLVRRRKESSFG